jgi:thiamine-phosphate pyrophosphorylase
VAEVATLSGLYAITDPCAGSGQALLDNVAAALRGGARVLQYRDKGSDGEQRLDEALALRRLCADFGALFIVNDDVELARLVGADGVHIGSDDTGLEEARRQLGDEAIIGVSCYNRLELAEQAVAAGADYVAFGRFFPSASKPEAVQAGPGLLRAAKAALSVPVVAIGGITPDNARSLIEHGADALAVIQGVFAQTDIEDAARQLASLFEQAK